MQRVLEGWTHVPRLDGTDSGESSLPEPSLVAEEEVPENLGHEWRVLHPFEPPTYRDPFYTGIGKGRGRGRGRRELMGERPPETQLEGFGQAQLEDLEEEMVENSILKAP